jgi:hypothetical protein
MPLELQYNAMNLAWEGGGGSTKLSPVEPLAGGGGGRLHGLGTKYSLALNLRGTPPREGGRPILTSIFGELLQ